MKIRNPSSQTPAVPTQQFGVSQMQREALHRRFQDAVAMSGEESPNAIMELARLCIGYGMKEQDVASPPMLWSAIEYFAELEDALACPHAKREGALAMSAFAFLLVGNGQAEKAVTFANLAYLILTDEKTTHHVDLARAAHVGALCWSRKGGIKNANAALTSAKKHLERVSREDYPDIFEEHAWLRHLVTSNPSAYAPSPGLPLDRAAGVPRIPRRDAAPPSQRPRTRLTVARFAVADRLLRKPFH